MNPFWSALVRDLKPYVPGEQPRLSNLVKLNTNENPYPPSPKVLDAIRGELGASLRLYPDPNSELLKLAAARDQGIGTNQVFVGNGSDEVLAHAFQALLKHPRPILFPDITYSFYPVYCGLYDIAYETVPLTESFEIRIEDYLRPNGGIVFPNPNAPTGRVLALADIETLLSRNADSVVIVDEAYIDFGGESATALVNRFPNLLVIQTLSKSRSLAGLRVGFAFGDPGLIEALERVKGSFNSYPLDRLAIVGGVAAFDDRDHFEWSRQSIMWTRQWVSQALADLGFEVLPSAANFVFARHPRYDGGELAAALRERHIIVRHFKLPRIDQFLRITVGTEEECQILLEALSELVAGKAAA